MTPRERTLAILLVAGIVLVGGALLGYMFVYSPLQEKWAATDNLTSEIDDLDSKTATINKLRPRFVEAKRQSLPPDVALATLQYQQMLEHLRPAGLPSPTDYIVKFSKEIPNTTAATPKIADKRPAYRRLEFTVDIDHTHLWQVVDFLGRFYQLDLLHQITEFRITRANKPFELRNDLDVYIRIEAIILDGVEPRSTLFPITNVVASIAGFPGVETVIHKPDLVQHIAPTVSTPVLATRGRDYSVIVKNDIFYGKLPPPETEPPFSFARIDDVEIKKPEEPPSLKVVLSGKGAADATITATVKDGSLFDLGPLEVDPKTRMIKLPKVTEELGSEASALVTIIATPAGGEPQKRLVTVTMGKPTDTRVVKKSGPDIAGVIKLTMITGSQVGDEMTFTAVIHDLANPFEYRIAVDSKGIRVSKMVQTPVAKARPPRMEFTAAKAYTDSHAANVLQFEDNWSDTKRTFHVIALEHEAVILAEVSAPAHDAKQPAGGKGRVGFPPGGRNPPQGKAEPIAIVAGNFATVMNVHAVQAKPSAYYRWPQGRSLKDVVNDDPKNPHRLSSDEVKKILQRVAEAGPLASIATVGN